MFAVLLKYLLERYFLYSLIPKLEDIVDPGDTEIVGQIARTDGSLY